MTEPYTYNTGEDDCDSGDDESVNSNSLTLENPYDIYHKHRDDRGNKRVQAHKKWKKRVMIWSILLIICSGVLVWSNIWYANVIGIAAGGIALYGVWKENSEFLFVYLVLLFLELLKNVGVFFYFVSPQGDNNKVHVALSIPFCIIEEIIVVPGNIYYAFRLYRTLKFSNDADLDETLSTYR